jgi:two-component system sensor histidine kinase/response regulator
MTSSDPLVLLVDDNPVNLDLLGTLLRGAGCITRAAISGRRGLDVARLAPPDLVMLDINMPEMDGYETCRTLKSDPELQHIPVIFISALDDPFDKVKAFQCGGADYVTKPFQAEEVLARVRHQFGLSRLQRELRERNRTLEEANLRLQEAKRMRDGFTAMLVHDLRSPLTSIGLALEVYREEREISPRTLDGCQQSLAKVLGLIQDLLEVLRGDGGDMPLQFHSEAPQAFFDLVKEHFQPQAEHKGITFSVNLGDLPESMRIDPLRLERAFANLLGNALKFTPPGGRIEVRAECEAGSGDRAGRPWLRVDIIDSGRGIPEDLLPHVFEPYYQTSEADRSHGVGLGLAIVKRIVAAHGGRVDVQSREGEGTVFTLWLPVE